MKDLFDIPEPEAAQCSEAREEALNLYMDGELPFEAQPVLFAHLATCSQCRRVMGAMLAFRRMSRQESIHVPPAVDEAIFGRLKDAKKRSTQRDRYWDRRPLWQFRGSVSLRAAALAAVMLFGAGLMFPQDAGMPLAAEVVSAEEDHIEPIPLVRLPADVLYVFYPGLTVEAPRIVEPVIQNAY